MGRNLAIFILSLFFLLVSGNLFVRFAKKFSEKILISPLIIGATLVAIGTSLPELFVAISSIAEKVEEVSLGNIIGSNIVNASFILGLGFLLSSHQINGKHTQVTNYFLILVTLLFAVIALLASGIPPYWGGIFLLFSIGFYVWYIRSGAKESKEQAALLGLERPPFGREPIVLLLGSLASLAFLLGSSKYLVTSGVRIAEMLSWPKEFIGLTAIAFGTSLPELITAIVAALKHEEKILLGNILGSNVFNLLFIGGITVLPKKIPLQDFLSMFTLIGVSALVFLIIHFYHGKKVPRFLGLLLIFLYVVFLVFSFENLA